MIEALSEFGWSQWPWNLPSGFSGVQGEGWPEELHAWVQAWAWWEYHRHHGEERGRSRCLLLGLQNHTGKAIWNLRRLGPLLPTFTVCITSSIRKSATLHLTKKSRAAETVLDGNNPSGVDAQSHGPRRWDGIFGFGWPNQKELVCWSRQHDFWSEDEGEWWRCCNHRHHQEASDYHLIQVMISVYSLAPVVLKALKCLASTWGPESPGKNLRWTKAVRPNNHQIVWRWYLSVVLLEMRTAMSRRWLVVQVPKQVLRHQNPSWDVRFLFGKMLGRNSTCSVCRLR